MHTSLAAIVISAAVAGLCCHSTTAFSHLPTLLPTSSITRNRYRSSTTTRLSVSIPGTVLEDQEEENQDDALPDNNNADIDNDTDKPLQVLNPKDPFVPTQVLSKRQRFRSALPQIFFAKPNDELDTTILKMAIPNMINLGVVPIVNSVDTFWVGRLGVALALAGQAAANQASFTLFFLIAFLPNITAPLVATAVASGNQKEAQQRVCESLFLCQVLGMMGTMLLVCFPRQVLGALVLPAGAPAMEYAAPYLRWRALGMVPALISATGFAAYRGMLNTVTPLKVSLLTQCINLIMDPVCMFQGGMGFVGAAVATAAAETVGGLTYLRLLFRNRLATWSGILRPPKMKSLIPLLQGGAAMLVRQLALNIGFLAATRRAQIMDPSGVSGAAYGIVMQIYSVGVILLVAMQATAAALIPASLAKSGKDGARQCADRLFAWSSLVGSLLGMAQFVFLPMLVPIFSTLPQVQQAVRLPALIASIIHVVNGPVFAGEGYMLGMGQYKDLALITAFGISAMVGCLASPLGKQLDGIMWSILVSSVLQSIGVVLHFLKVGPLARSRKERQLAAANAAY
jgi:putative MATE family efflux protein